MFLLHDRLCYADAPGAAPSARYLPLDRVPVRALPRGYGSHVGVTVLEDHQFAGTACGRSSNGPWAGVERTFSVQCGRHTHLLRADSAAEAEVRLWLLKQKVPTSCMSPLHCAMVAIMHFMCSECTLRNYIKMIHDL